MKPLKFGTTVHMYAYIYIHIIYIDLYNYASPAKTG